MDLIIVTGMSGAGKSKAVEALEDISFYCVDNIPPQLIHPFVDICNRTKIKRVALVVDIRGGMLYSALMDQLEKIKEQGIDCKILFLDASDDVIVSRYKETRRKHPLLDKNCDTLVEAIKTEREKLNFFKVIASYVIDTSRLSMMELKEKITDLFIEELRSGMIINCISFGFKNGLPHDADIVFDVRFLPNPFYVSYLKNRTGLESSVQEYVMKSKESQQFKEKLLDMLDYLLPLYKSEGKGQLVIAIGCTGGKHRSVTFVELLAKHFMERDIKVVVTHRDLNRQKFKD